MAQKLKHAGVPIYMNERLYYIPSLTVREFIDNQDDLENPGRGDRTLFQLVKIFLPLIGVAIRKNHPEVSDSDLENWIDLYTFPEAIGAIRAASGIKFVKQSEGEETPVVN